MTPLEVQAVADFRRVEAATSEGGQVAIFAKGRLIAERTGVEAQEVIAMGSADKTQDGYAIYRVRQRQFHPANDAIGLLRSLYAIVS